MTSVAANHPGSPVRDTLPTLRDGDSDHHVEGAPNHRSESEPDFEKARETHADSDADNKHLDTNDDGHYENDDEHHQLSRHRTAMVGDMSLLRELLINVCASSAQLFTQAGLALSIAPLHSIGPTFGVSGPGPSAAKLSWLPAAFSLTVGTFILPSGRWGDAVGYKPVLVFGYVWYAVWMLVGGFAAFSHNFIFFAFCRAMQGIGPAIVMPNAVAILTRVYSQASPRRKNLAVSMFGGVAPGGYLFGAVISGLFAQLVWWPWAYWVIGILLAVVALLSFVVMPSVRGYGWKGLSDLDPIGSALGVAGLIFVNFAFNQGAVAGWQKVYVYVLMIVGVACFVAFVLYEGHWSPHPLVPTHHLSHDILLVLGCIACGWGSFGIWVYYYWQFLEVLRHHSILLSTAQMSPCMISGACAAIICGQLLRKQVNPGVIMAAAMMGFAVGNIMLATMPVHEVYWAQAFVASCITPFGMDMSFPAGVIILTDKVEKRFQGMAASLVNTVQNYSISIGLGFAGLIEAHVNGGGWTSRQLLHGYRGATYFAIGIDVLAMGLSSWLIYSYLNIRRRRADEEHAGEQSAEG